MERKEVYRIIDGERDYQDGTHHTMLVPDSEKSIAEWLIYMEVQINEAKLSVYNLDREKTLSHIRKATTLGVRAMEIHGAPERKF